MSEPFTYNLGLSIISTIELQNLKLDNEKLKIRIGELLKDKDFLQKQILIYMK